MVANAWMYLISQMNEPYMLNLVCQMFIFAVSIIFLVKFSDIVVKNAVKLAKITRLGELVVGFIFISIATNLPEMAVAFSSIVSENVDITIGNLFGASIADLALVFGIHSIIAPLTIKRGTFKKLPVILFITSTIPIMLLVMQHVESYVGIILILAYAAFAAYSMKQKINLKIKKRRTKGLLNQILMPLEFYRTVSMLLVASFVVLVSSHFLVESSSNISMSAGIAESVIGATIISMGTCLPELSVSLTAIRTKHSNLGIGNILGSCLTKLTLILGVVLLMSPVTIYMGLYAVFLFFMIATSLLTWYFLTTERMLDRNEGIFLIAVYVLFLISTLGTHAIFA